MRWILLLPLMFVVILFGLSNRGPVTLTLWPFDVAWVAPLSVAVLVLAGVSFLLGAAIAWGAGLRWRHRAHQAEEASKLLGNELAEYRAELARRMGPVPPAPGTNLVRLQRPAA